MNRSCAGLLAALLLLAGCDLPGSDDGRRSAVGLEAGAVFNYAWNFTEIDSAGGAQVIAQDLFIVLVAETDAKVGALRDLLRIEAFSAATDTASSDIWYRETPDELAEVAYGAANVTPLVTPKRDAAVAPAAPFAQPKTLARLLERHRLGGGPASADSSIIRAEPRIVYRFPLKAGARWTAFRTPFLQTREVVGEETVTVQAGTFRCARVRTRLPDLAPELEWTDYVAEQGLILRTIEMTSERRDSQNNPIGTLVTRERLELIRRSRK